MLYSYLAYTERGAARLAHRSGGPGVVGSNPIAPTTLLWTDFASGDPAIALMKLVQESPEFFLDVFCIF